MATPREHAACIRVPETTYASDSSASPIRVCVIDLGTNSFHAVIVDAYPNGSFQIVDRMKEMVRLGQHGLSDSTLPEDAIERGMQALKRIHLLARGWDTHEFMAFATSAIREASNGGVLIRRARQELGLRIRPINGEQEAHLIFQGVTRAVDVPESSLLVDVGGGSVEFIVVDQGKDVFARSLKLGAARMTEQYVATDPMSEDEQARLRAHCKGELEEVLTVCRDYGVTTVVGSSGTMKSLARVTVEEFGDQTRTIFQQALPVQEVRMALRWVMRSSAEERRAHVAIDPKRVDQIGAGAVLLDTLCAGLPSVQQVRVSPNALREGMVVHFIEENYTRLRQMASYRDPRRRSVHEIAFRFQWEERHAQHVAATATFLFHVCHPLYDGPKSDVELLEYAALLHDVGYLISHDEHQKHSRYLIKHADLQGFQPEEVSIISLVARYHRNAKPSSSHEHFRCLSPEEQKRVRQLASLLRIAEGLDRSHFQNVVALRSRLTDQALHLFLATKGDPQLEVWAGKEEGGLFEEVFDRTLYVEPTTISAKTNGQATPSVSHATQS